MQVGPKKSNSVHVLGVVFVMVEYCVIMRLKFLVVQGLEMRNSLMFAWVGVFYYLHAQCTLSEYFEGVIIGM